MSRRGTLTVALDIGTSKIVVLVGDAGEPGVPVVGVGSALMEGGMRKGVVVSIEETAAAIDHAVKEAQLSAGCEIHSVMTNVGGGHVRGINSHAAVPVRGDEVAAADVNRVIEAVRQFSLPPDQEVLHLLLQDFVLDGEEGIADPVGMMGRRLESRVHLLTSSVAAVQNVRKCCQKSRLQVARIVFGPLASAEVVLTPEERELGVALVELGAGTTSLLVYRRGALCHTSVLPVGGDHVSLDLAASLQVPLRDAERLKIQSGAAQARRVGREQKVELPATGSREAGLASRSALAAVIEARVEETLSLVRKQMEKAGVARGLGGGIVLSGGGAELHGLVSLAREVFQKPVRLGVSVATPGSPGEGEGRREEAALNSPAYATARGLLRLGQNPLPDWSTGGLENRLLGRWRARLRGIVDTFFE